LSGQDDIVNGCELPFVRIALEEVLHYHNVAMQPGFQFGSQEKIEDSEKMSDDVRRRFQIQSGPEKD
jgi:hypothetical protein